MGARGYQRKGGRGSAAPGRVRIVAGRFRGRRLPVANAPGLRPTPERTRETLFNWLQGRMTDARVLDLFAGSGALGLEALSRGAAHLTQVEASSALCRQLRSNAATLEAADAVAVVCADALRWLRRASGPFDLVLIDPPFDSTLAEASLALLLEQDLLAADGRIYCEAGSGQTPPWAALTELEVLRETRAGDSRGVLLGRAPPAAV